MKQREAVYNAVHEVIDFTDGETFDVTTEDRKTITDKVVAGFQADEVDFSDSAKTKYDTDAKLKSYVSGLISNWLRKDMRLNGNINYVPKNPGSRTGQGDPQIRELRKLLSINKGTKDEAEIQGYIDRRLEQLKAEKAKNVEIDTSVLPEELQDLAS